MLTIRMRRMGAKRRPYYRVVVTEARSPRDGRSVEVLGHYDPATQPERLELNRERLAHWLSRGAQPSDTVRTLLGRHPVADTAVDTPTETAPPPDAPAAAETEPAQS